MLDVTHDYSLRTFLEYFRRELLAQSESQDIEVRFCTIPQTPGMFGLRRRCDGLGLDEIHVVKIYRQPSAFENSRAMDTLFTPSFVSLFGTKPIVKDLEH